MEPIRHLEAGSLDDGLFDDIESKRTLSLVHHPVVIVASENALSIAFCARYILCKLIEGRQADTELEQASYVLKVSSLDTILPALVTSFFILCSAPLYIQVCANACMYMRAC